MNPQTSMPEPDRRVREEYGRRLEDRRARAARHERLHVRIGNLRLAVAASAAVIAWFAFRRTLSPWWLLAPGVSFLALVVWHERVLGNRRKAQRSVSFYERAFARLEDRWAGTGEPGNRFLEESHPYAGDLDLFGRGSLFELISMARTLAGEDTLASWLKQGAPPTEVRARQEAVAELRPRLDLREGLAITGEDMRTGVDARALSQWGSAPAAPISGWTRAAAALLGAATLASLVFWGIYGEGSYFFILALGELLFELRLRGKVRGIVEGAESAAQGLAVLAKVLERFEKEPFSSPKLAGLRRDLETGGAAPSERIARLDRLVTLLDWRRNMIFAPVAAILLWGTQLAFAIESWRKESGPAVTRWIAAVGEMEALSSLAGYAWEHPADPFPEIRPEGTCFEGEALGHPLIPERSCVRNDVRFCGGLRVLVVSGSNMSGKSTYLRTVGVNAVLALAGAPVRARRLVLAPLVLGASIRILDSLQEGSSHFYAEIKRLRLLLDLARGPLPLLFLIDELLHGTNSHDRRIGAEAVVKDLVRRGAMGLVTTHDLALSRIAETLAAQVANVHFEDYIHEGKIAFDYRLRPGVVEKSNALELMRSVGLDV